MRNVLWSAHRSQKAEGRRQKAEVESLVIRGGTVDRGDSRAAHPQIHAELAPVVDEVVQHEHPEHRDAGAGTISFQNQSTPNRRHCVPQVLRLRTPAAKKEGRPMAALFIASHLVE